MEMTDAEAQQRQAYLEKLQAAANKKPFHKTPAFFIGLGIIGSILIGGSLVAYFRNADTAAQQAETARLDAILKRATAISKPDKKTVQAAVKKGSISAEDGERITKYGVSTLAEAKAVGADVSLTEEEANSIIYIVLHFDERTEHGHNRFGKDPKGTAKMACVLLGIAAENNNKICDTVFKTLADNATEMDSDLLRFLLNRLTKADIPKLRSKLNSLAKPLNAKDHGEVLAVIWDYKSRVCSEKDVDVIIDLLKQDKQPDKLLAAIRQYIVTLYKVKVHEEDKKAQIGEKIFAAIKSNDELLGTQHMMRILGMSCSTSAKAYYLKKLENKKDWRKYSYFLGQWHNDDIIPEIIALRDGCDENDAKDKKNAEMMDTAIMMVLTQNRDRDTDKAKELLRLAYDSFDEDTSGIQALLDYVDNENNKSAADYQEKVDEYNRLEKILNQKKRVIKRLSTHVAAKYEWVDAILDDIESECARVENSINHNELSQMVTNAREAINKNIAKQAEKENAQSNKDKQD